MVGGVVYLMFLFQVAQKREFEWKCVCERARVCVSVCARAIVFVCLYGPAHLLV